MKLMGLIPAAHWTSWFITCFVYLVVAMAIYTVLFGVKIVKASGAVLNHTDPSLFYVFLLFYAAAIVSFCFMVSTFVQKGQSEFTFLVRSESRLRCERLVTSDTVCGIV